MHLTPTVLLLASTAFALPLRSTSPPSTPLSTRGLINLHLDLSSLLPPVVCDTLEGLLGGRFCASLSNITIAIDDGPPKHPLNTTSSSSSSSSDVDFFIDDDDEAESSPSDTDPPRIVSESESDPIAEPSLAPSPSLETPPTPDDLLSSSSPVPPPPCDPLSPLCPSLPNDTTLALALPLLTEKRTLLDLGELLGEPEEYKKPEFKPRANAGGTKKFKKKDGDDKDKDSKWRDRAAERRDGKDGDFSAAERLLEDFKARADAAEDKQAIEEQMKYLGGDAEHSVLVKGLDMALLERMRSQHSLSSDLSISQVEDELDRVLTEKPKKRTRDEMVAELKAKRESGPAGEEEEEGGKPKEKSLEEAVKAGRFKPINKPSATSKGKAKEKEEGGGEKKRRKKKRPDATAASGSMAPPPLPSSKLAPPPPSPAVVLPPGFDEDDDIFGDAGDYKGLDSDSDDDAAPSSSLPIPPPPPTASSSSTTTKRKYFDDDDDDEDSSMATTAPTSVSKLAAASAEHAARAAAPSVGGEGDDEGEGEGEAVPMRLQPLSGSALPSVRELLDMDAAAEKEELRKAKKLKNKVEAGDRQERKVRTAEDKANHEYQEMQNFLDKKEKRAKGIQVDEDE
ncbi:hypothetical protein RQP46_004221 [Phenoliferia psychrophenolica]